jgi:hypothetical protein
MNLRGSYRALRNNSKAAMLAAIEIYNKPQIEYRDECFLILLVNAWELFLKAILSKNKQRIFYPKRRDESYRTLSIQDTLHKAKAFFPSDIPFEPVARNIEMLTTHRNNTIHFYNQRDLGVIIYGLAQTSIINYKDLMVSIFGIDIANEMTLSLLPLAFGTYPDPIEFLQRAKSNPPRNKAVAQFLRQLSQATKELEEQRFDTSRFLTVFTVKLNSVKKVSSADVVVGVKGLSDNGEPLIIEKRVDPNISHTLRQKDILAQVGDELCGVRFTSFTFAAIVWKYEIKEKRHLCWHSDVGGLTKYSEDVLALLRRLSRDEIEVAVDEYREYCKQRRKSR